MMSLAVYYQKITAVPSAVNRPFQIKRHSQVKNSRVWMKVLWLCIKNKIDDGTIYFQGTNVMNSKVRSVIHWNFAFEKYFETLHPLYIFFSGPSRKEKLTFPLKTFCKILQTFQKKKGFSSFWTFPH